MAKKEKKWFGITRSPEEDLALVEIIKSSRTLTLRRLLVVMVMSLIILGVYILMNISFFPAYPVVTSFAERNDVFTENYPPFRIFEWANYSITREITEGRVYEPNTFSRLHPIGYPVLAMPLTLKWGQRGMYYTNAIILWISALVFFFLMLEMVEYPLAVASTMILALATPNIFYATSAFPEPTAQLFTVLSIFLFVKGLIAQREWVFYLLSGFAIGLNLFVKPSMSLAIVLFVVLLVYERGKFSLTDRNLLSLALGFLVPLITCLILNKIYLGEFGALIASRPECAYNLTTRHVFGEEGNIFTGIWKLLFDSPHGLVFIMPVITVVPMGIIVMWRNEIHAVTLIVGVFLAYLVLITAVGLCPVTGESVGSRQLLPILPMLIIPLAFLWREQAGEKIWLAVTLFLTIYMCTFGWWTGTTRGRGMFIGALQDRDARAIILARKDLLAQPEVSSANELADRYIESLKHRDMMGWLKTLNRDTVTDIHGFERVIFNELCRKVAGGASGRDDLIESADPNEGVRPVLPSLDFSIENELE